METTMTMSVHWDHIHRGSQSGRAHLKTALVEAAKNALPVAGLVVAVLAAVAIRVYVFVPVLP